MKAHRPNRSKLERAFKRRDKLRRNICRRCPFRGPKGRCLNTTLRSGRCGDWVYYLLRGNKQYRRRWIRPKDPRTTAQVQSRARLGTISRHYGARLTEQERAACIAAGAKRQSRPRLGQSGPLTGQQYSVRKAYAKNAAAKVQNTRIPAKVPQPQKLTRPTWGLHRSWSRGSPETQGRGWLVPGKGREAVASSEVPPSRRGARTTRARRRRDTGSSGMRRARLMRKMGVRLMPGRRPAARLFAAPIRALGGG
jgi:hypothetical protein